MRNFQTSAEVSGPPALAESTTCTPRGVIEGAVPAVHKGPLGGGALDAFVHGEN